MTNAVVADSSCLIALSKIERLQVLHQLFGRVLIPEAVFQEVAIKGAGRPGAKEVANAEWIEHDYVKDRLAVRALNLSLGVGESEAIILASEKNAKYLILDDWKARQMALGLSLPVIGTVSVLAKAVKLEFLQTDLQSILEQLKQVGFHFWLSAPPE